MDAALTCILCGSSDETRNHLFFECSYSKKVWFDILEKLNIISASVSWEIILPWLVTVAPNRYVSLAVLQGWQACINEIWAEHNRRYHHGLSILEPMIIGRIIRVIRDKSAALKLYRFRVWRATHCYLVSRLTFYLQAHKHLSRFCCRIK